MTNAGGRTSRDTRSMLTVFQSSASERKGWLLAAAYGRSVWHLLHDRGRRAIEMVERFADRTASDEELIAVFGEYYSAREVGGQAPGAPQAAEAIGHLGWRWRWWAQQGSLGRSPRSSSDDARWAVTAVSRSAAEALAKVVPWEEARASQSDLILDVLGHPLRPGTVTSDIVAWNGGTIPRLAQAFYETRAFDQLSILADALEEAGCTDAAALDHCRQPGDHVRGCWVVDLLLGKV